MAKKTSTTYKSPAKTGLKKKASTKKTTKEQINTELEKIPEKMQDIIVNGIVRDLLIIIFVPLLYNIVRNSWAEIVTLPLLSDNSLHQISNLIVIVINFYENYIDLHQKRNIITAAVDFTVNIIIGYAFTDPSFYLIGAGYLGIAGLRLWFNYREKKKE